MLPDVSSIDHNSFFLGIGFILAFLIVSSVTDLICSFANWIYEKALQLRKARLGSRPSLLKRIWSKIRSFYDVNPS